jgi:HPt (histidine-containing phosphotransfer) domain-containing protein
MATAEPADDEVLSLRVVEAMFAIPGRESAALLPELMAIFLREESARLVEIPRLAAARRGPELARAAHQLGGGCAVVGATQLQRAAIALEDAARAGNWPDIADRLALVQGGWVRLQAVLARRGLA